MFKAKEKISTIRNIKEFNVKDGQCLIISDPFYDDIEALIPNTDTKINHRIKAKAGTWVYKFDPITKALSVYEKSSFDSRAPELNLEENEFDEILNFCVDTGQVGVFLEDSYHNDSLLEDVEFENENYNTITEAWCRACCETTSSKDGMGFVPYGFVEATRWGDGIFPAGLIYSKDTNEVTYIKIETHHVFDDSFLI